jgi:hypothetical protein
MTVRSLTNDYVLAHSEKFPRDESKTQTEHVNNDDIEFKESVLNALKNLK